MARCLLWRGVDLAGLCDGKLVDRLLSWPHQHHLHLRGLRLAGRAALLGLFFGPDILRRRRTNARESGAKRAHARASAARDSGQTRREPRLRAAATRLEYSSIAFWGLVYRTR